MKLDLEYRKGQERNRGRLFFLRQAFGHLFFRKGILAVPLSIERPGHAVKGKEYIGVDTQPPV
jgi:hypothetical protein